MAYICDKGISCSKCSHYRYDEDYGGNACFAAYDEANPKHCEEKEQPNTEECLDYSASMSNPYEKLEAQVRPCPFCGKRMKFYRETHVNRFGHEITSQYFMHADEEDSISTRCILDEIAMPFVIGAGDANVETGYIGEYATKWNKRVKEGLLKG